MKYKYYKQISELLNAAILKENIASCVIFFLLFFPFLNNAEIRTAVLLHAILAKRKMKGKKYMHLEVNPLL